MQSYTPMGDPKKLHPPLKRPPPCAIWIYFCDGVPVAIVKHDGLPFSIESEDKARACFPIEIGKDKNGISSVLSDGSKALKAWDSALVLFQRDLYGTKSFLSPLEEQADEFSRTEMEQLRELLGYVANTTFLQATGQADTARHLDEDQQPATGKAKKTIPPKSPGRPRSYCVDDKKRVLDAKTANPFLKNADLSKLVFGTQNKTRIVALIIDADRQRRKRAS